MKKSHVFTELCICLQFWSLGQNTPTTTYQFASKPSWADEFNKNGLPDSTKWNYDVGGHGWGNNELQYYTEKNLKNTRIENGILIIEAHKERLNDNAYTSARLVTKGKGDFLYGRFKIRAKLPIGRGTWPAIWMLATNPIYDKNYLPNNGEIDIMEHVGYDPGRVHTTLHTKNFNQNKGTQPSGNRKLADFHSAFHTYHIDWTPDKIEAFIDNELVLSFPKVSNKWEDYPFDQPFHLLLNIAIGGGWGGLKGIDESIFPQRMEIDYVRVYPLKSITRKK
ncbi:glycoside hydrolase family 16 protein [Flectobacillus longus]|uniref:glycoside hydrolase family 16 protein n=1 Tax=Flectobacillus longus TaxID=2984207 RepID=UPI0024B656B1|nr:glycoside hydrolase family 16 protein [Flectobacillus longus]MDI9879510.1 glycoside hydrolase family 16 protein [Flectobacillus longus]